jgi:SAM-dependent methyltransferase
MIINGIDKGRDFDFGKTTSAYARYRDIYPEELYDRLRALGAGADGSAWLDLGTGTGVLPKNLYNPKAAITGVDISEEQIAFAKREAEKSGRNINYIVSPAESTGLPGNSFDIITAAQCFWYFDREKMRSEIKRLLKPGGKFVKIFMNWDTGDTIASQSIASVIKYNPAWSGGITGDADMYDDIFPGRQTEIFYADLPFTRESWHGRMLACRGTLASMDEKTLKEWETCHLLILSQCPAQFTIRHKVYISHFVTEK